MVLELKGIKKSFRKKSTLIDINLSVEKGSIVGLLGRNGSGKSTLLSILAGVQKSDEGEFLLNGANLFEQKKLRSEKVGYIPQGTPLLEELSAYDNLLLWYTKEALKKELKTGVLKMLGVDEFIKVPVSKMSGGMKKRLSIGCSVARNPEILLLDEPTAALDLICKEKIASYLRDCREKGKILLLATHDEAELELCDKLYILKDGKLCDFSYNGNISELVESL